LAQTSLQNSRAPLRNGLSACTVQWQPGQAHCSVAGLSRVVVMDCPCSVPLEPVWCRQRLGGTACRTDKQGRRIY